MSRLPPNMIQNIHFRTRGLFAEIAWVTETFFRFRLTGLFFGVNAIPRIGDVFDGIFAGVFELHRLVGVVLTFAHHETLKKKKIWVLAHVTAFRKFESRWKTCVEKIGQFLLYKNYSNSTDHVFEHVVLHFRKRWWRLVSAQLSIKFGYCHSWFF